MKSRSLFVVATTFLILAAVCIIVWYSPWGSGPKPIEAATDPAGSEPASLSLTPAKIEAAGIKVEPALIRSFQAERTVPGQIHYDETKHVELRLATEGVIRELFVRPGDRLTAGQVVAVVESPEIGQRRAEVLLYIAEEQIAERNRELATTTQKNLSRLLARLKESVEVPTLLTEFENEPLGEYREAILASYSKRSLANQLIAKLRPLASEGIASARSLLELQSNRETSEAAFQAACETARIQTVQQALKTETAAAEARRQTAIARERLNSLVGATGGSDQMAHEESALSLWRLKAPIAGTVEELPVAASERVTSTTSVMTIADTTSLWVHAEIRDRDWGSLALVRGQQVRIEASALPGQLLAGEVVYVGRTQDAETRAVPIVVRIANGSDRLRPGMFARVLLPEGKRRDILAIPASALVQAERRHFVFVQEAPGVFRDVDVVPGSRNADWVAIEHGLKSGDNVVVHGAFALKGELLLEPED
ncbi:MAG TPA: efflux RND transporter periplasmic adaptor subunit [Planctomycetaceae bacterium]|nr:efflux RND transporter periplasmic adaptor subunit [Planctomycetaceae bacterium]